MQHGKNVSFLFLRHIVKLLNVGKTLLFLIFKESYEL